MKRTIPAALCLGALLLGGCGLTAPPQTVTIAPAPSDSPAQPAASLQDFTKAEKAALRIRNIGCGNVSTGSGFAIGKHLLVTNRHVVGGADVLQVQTFDGQDIQVTTAGATTLADLAIVRTKQALPAAITLAKTNPDVGEEVTAVGYPLGGQLTTTTGHVLDYGVDLVGWSNLPMLINDAPIEHGSSGSPLLNEDGKLVGVAYAGDDNTGREYAVPVEVLNEVITSPKGFDKTAACDGVPQAVNIPPEATTCSATVYAGARTSCPFALEVERAWTQAGGGDADITAYSPVTKLDYQLSCVGGQVVTCTATTGATIYIQQ